MTGVVFFMKILTYLTYLLVLFPALCQQGEHSIQLNIEVPVQMGIGYDYQWTDRISSGVQVGILREPNSSIILASLDALGTDDATLDLIENAFSSGWVYEVDVHYHFSGFYAGIFTQYARLSGKETPEELLVQITGNELPQRRRIRQEKDITLESDLWQFGVLIGKKFDIGERGFLFTEIGFSMNIGSESTVKSEERNLAATSQFIEEYLSDIYASYAFIPSVSFGYGITF